MPFLPSSMWFYDSGTGHGLIHLVHTVCSFGIFSESLKYFEN